MTQTTTRQPLPARFDADMSTGYAWGNGQFEPKKFEIVNGAAPAGSIGSTAADMAKFMIAHLNDGALGDVRILGDSTARLMHARTFTHDPRIPGFALGFYEKSANGLRIIGHGGDTRWFHSDLALIPSERVGVFVSYNTNTGGELSFGPFLHEFLDHYYPFTPPPAMAPADAAEQARNVAGAYAFNRRSYTTFQKALGLSGDMYVTATDSGRVLLASPLGNMHLDPVGPMLYRDRSSNDLVAFKTSGPGHVEYGFLGEAPMMVMERVPWYQLAKLHWVVLGLGAIVFLGTIVAAVRRAIRVRLGAGRPEDLLPGRWMLVGLALLNLVFPVAAGVIIGSSGGLLENPLTGLKVVLALPVIAALLTLGAVAMSVRQWRSGAGTRGARIRYDVVVALSVLFIWSLNQWNLLGWRM
jgi:hypothetical protein